MEATPIDPLSDLLRSTGVTSTDLSNRLRARSVYVSPQAVSSWYRGETRPRDELRAVVAEALGMDLDRLLRACAGVAS